MRKRTLTPLANMRRSRTLTQAQLASLIGVTQQTYCQWERGAQMPSVDMQTLIATILGAKSHDLFPSTAAPEPDSTPEAVA